MTKIAIVLGGTGTVGSATATAFLKESSVSKVVVTSRSQEKLDELEKELKSGLSDDVAFRVIGIVGNLHCENGAKDMQAKVIAAVGDKIDFAVSAMGFGWFSHDALATTSAAKIDEALKMQLYPAFECWKVIMPLVRNASGSYVFVTGGGPDMFLGPGTGGLTIAGSTSTAFAKVAMKETAGDGFTCTEVSFQARICRDPSVKPPSPITWLVSTDAGRALVSVALKRKAHVQTIVISTIEEMNEVIANGITIPLVPAIIHYL